MLGYFVSKVKGVKLKTIFLVLAILSPCFYAVQLVLGYFLSLPLKRQPVLLWWTPFTSETGQIIDCYDGQYQCLLTNDRNYCFSSNLGSYLFYGSRFNISDLPVPKNADEPWSIFHEESPRNEAVFLYDETWELFDIVSTFSRYSDFPVTHQYLENLNAIKDTQYYIAVEQKNNLLSNLAPVLYIQSDCDTPVDRDSYVTELMKYIPVDSYGQCLRNKEFPKEISDLNPLDSYNEKILKFIAQYKFVIAFENAVCDDYITEKLWRPLVAGSIPIYFGSPTVQDWLPNEKSAILVKNYDSPRLLAELLNKLNRNDDLYKEFMQHKFGTISNSLLIEIMSKGPFGIKTDKYQLIPAFECFVCRAVHNNRIHSYKKQRKRSVYKCLQPDIGNSWDQHWKRGKCQSQALRKISSRGGKFDDTEC